MSKSSANQAPKPLSDADVAAYAEPDMNEAFRSLATEVQERRTLDAKRRCDNCAHGYVHPRYSVDEVGVRCDWMNGAFHFKPDYYCARWEEPK